MNKLFISLLFLLLFSACANKDKHTSKVNRNFNLPVIVQKPLKHPVQLAQVDSLNAVWFRFYGKYTFTDTLYLDQNSAKDTTYLKDFIREYSHPKIDDTLSTDGFQLFIDYKTTICIKTDYMVRIDTGYYFPAYVVNESSRTKVFIGKDSYVFGIQEAVDTSDYDLWRPIESKGFDFCGNGYFGLKVHPGEFILFLVPKYSGSEQGKMRIRLRIGESTYLSPSFDGVFNPGQFKIKKNTWYYQDLKTNKADAIQFMFYGAKPKGFDDED
jgi:hypothetical protein